MRVSTKHNAITTTTQKSDVRKKTQAPQTQLFTARIYPKVLPVEEDLWDLLPRQPLLQLFHVVFAHVDVSLLKMHPEPNHDLAELRALDLGHEHRPDRRRVHDEHAAVFGSQ